jgi:hypothetical protein
MDHKTLLDDLGGPHAVHTALVAKGVDVKPVTVRAWALPGRTIPAKYWVPIVEIARDKDVAITFQGLAESVKAAA